MISFFTIVNILVSHYVADFIFQTREQGEGKSKDVKILMKHIVVYSCVLAVLTSFFLIPTLGFQGWGIYILANGLIHFIVDFYTSRISRKAYEVGNLHIFWWVIGADQLLHALTLFFTYFTILGI